MKAFLVVNQLNDPFYIDYDASFAEYIIDRAKQNGLLENDTEVTELDANLVMQLFSPLVLSQWLLIDQTKQPCSAIHCPNGFIFVFRHVDDMLFMTINGDGTETEIFMHRKIKVFIRLMRFLFGPVSEEMGLSHLVSKKAKWDFLRRITHHWFFLVHTEQAFMVEAIERINVNQVINEKSVEILEKAVKQIQAARDIPTQHALLLVNNKLLALYSNRNAHELQPRDILSLTVLAGTLYPQTDRLEDLFSRQYAGPQCKPDSSTNSEDNSDAEGDVYHSAPNTPGDVNRSRSSSLKSFQNIDEETLRNKFTPGTSPDTQRAADSLSETETVKLTASYDQGSVSHAEKKSGYSLLELYKEKYPDSKSVIEEILHKDFETSNDGSDHLIEVQVDVHHPEHSNSNSNNKNTIPKTSELDEESSNNKDLIKNLKELQLDIPSENDLEKCGSDTSPASVSCLSKKEKDDLCERLSSPSGVSPDGNLTGSYQSCKEKRSTPSILHPETTCQDNNDVSRPSMESSEHSQEQEESSIMSEISRSSSAMSNISKSYPELTAHFGDSHLASRLTPFNIGSNSGAKKSSPVPGSPKPHDMSSTTESSYYTSVKSPPRSTANYSPQTVFLKSPTCRYSPYNIHTAQVLPGVTLILLSQSPRHIFADYLHQVIHNVQDLLYGRRSELPRSSSLHVYEVINSQLLKLHNSLKRFKGKVRNLSSDIHARWEKEDLKRKLLDFLEKDKRTPIPPELESPLLEMYKRLKELFSYLFLHPYQESPAIVDTLSQLRVRINAELLDYREYLNVKSQRNVTMTSYIDDFPGLIHFIFIDRHFHQITAPSLNISVENGESVDATSFLKEKIWQMYQCMMRRLTEGYTTLMMREGDFYYSYFLWFEDYAGNALPVQESFKPNKVMPYPGILSGSFYSKLLQHCFPQAIQGSVRCFEMFLLHLGSVHPQYVAAHCKKLAAKMWELSGEPYTTPSLF